MPKPLYKTNNWKQYNHALINRGSLTFWIDEEAIIEWKQGKRGKTRIFSDLVITTALIFSMPLRSSQGLWIPCFDLLNFHCAARTTVVSVVEPKTLM
nr:transposase [Vibrio parahaemolyticus]